MESQKASQKAQQEKAAKASKVGVVVWGVRNPLVAGSAFCANISIKSLGGGSLREVKVQVKDERGNVIACVEPELEHDATCAAFELGLKAPCQAGGVTWRVEVISNQEILGMRPLPLSVTPMPNRRACVRVCDAETGGPLSNASLFFYNDNLKKVKPPQAVSGDDGWARTDIVADAPYTVRVECVNHDEGICRLPAGAVDMPAEGVAILSTSALEEENLVVMHGSVRGGR